jgi:hypothetical protein
VSDSCPAGRLATARPAFWAAVRSQLGDAAGTRALIEVLLLHRHLDRADVPAGNTAALSVGSTSADVVAVEARKAAHARGATAEPEPVSPRRGVRAVSLTERRLAALPGDDRPLRRLIDMTSCGLGLAVSARRGVTEQAAAAAIEQGCRMLRLPTIRDRFSEIAAASEREQLSYVGFLAELVMADCDDRDRRRAARRVHEAGFPRPKLLSEFEFDANPAINPVIGQLATCAWVKARHALCLIGESGTGTSLRRT